MKKAADFIICFALTLAIVPFGLTGAFLLMWKAYELSAKFWKWVLW